MAHIQQMYGYNSFSRHNYQQYVTFLTQIAIDTDKGGLLATQLIAQFRTEKVLLPTPLVIDKICAEAITRANKIIYERLTADLTQTHLDKLDGLLQHKADTKFTYLGWLRQTPLKPSSTQMNCHIARLK